MNNNKKAMGIRTQPQSRNDASGKPYAFGKVRAATKEGESLFISVIVFGDAVAPFLALSDGDAVALAGSLSPKAWTDKEGQPRPALDMQVRQVLSVHQLSKKREQSQG
jgi:single-stranded DNA-binding protein